MVKSFGNETGVRPLGSRVLIKPYTKEELEPKNSFGLILPNSDSKEKSDQGVVVAVGPGEYREGKLVAIGVKVGDKVAFSKYGYEDIKVDGQDFFLIKEENILAIIQ
ncbi:MAG: co-chaperone GroES [Parcubacteria group bacterium]